MSALTATPISSGGAFDSKVVNGMMVPAASIWTRVATVSPNGPRGEVRADINVTGGVAKLRLTRAALGGNPHGILQTDLTQVNKYVPLATINGTGTVNQLNDGDIVSVNVDTLAGAEIGYELQLVSGSPLVRVTGTLQSD